MCDWRARRAAGSITYFDSFCVDTVGNRAAADVDGLSSAEPVPLFDQARGTHAIQCPSHFIALLTHAQTDMTAIGDGAAPADALLADSDDDLPLTAPRAARACFNCNDTSHGFIDCPHPMNTKAWCCAPPSRVTAAADPGEPAEVPG